VLLNSAHAAGWNFYGSARVSTFYERVAVSRTNITQFAMGLQDNSRIGANVKVSDELTGRFEYGPEDGKADIRYLYGVWIYANRTGQPGQKCGQFYYVQFPITLANGRVK
jgi:hypothetical protein